LGLPNLTAQFQSVFARHHDVENENRRPLPLGFGNHGVPGGKYFYHISRAFQVVAYQPGNIGIIFNYKYARIHIAILAGKPKFSPDCNLIETIRRMDEAW